jgi:glucose-6-phosphate isomerase
LLQLAEETQLKAAINAMFSGEKINETKKEQFYTLL